MKKDLWGYLRNVKITPEKVFFILAVVFSVLVTYVATGYCIDSDASSELVLAEHLAKTGQLLSDDWIYSTELRILNTQLIYAPLFLVFSSWHMVRFVGALILQAILLLSFFGFTRLMDMEKKVFYLCGGILLLPVSVCWGRIVLYNCYYVPHISICLWITGLTFTKRYNAKRMILLGALSFVGGLSGIRQLMMTHAPAVVVVFIHWWLHDYRNKNQNEAFLKIKYPLILTTAFAAAMSFAGFVVNKLYLSQRFIFSDQSINVIRLLDAGNIKAVLYGFFHHFGFRDEIGLVTLLGVLSALGILLGIFCVLISVSQILRHEDHTDLTEVLPYTFFVAFILVMLLVFLVIGNEYYFVLYFTPMVIWMVPVLVLQMKTHTPDSSAWDLKRILPVLAVGVLLINGIVNGGYFADQTDYSQKYEGLQYQVKNQKARMAAVVEFLERENYELGYATFWNGNIVTEMTDGDIKMIHLRIDADSGETELNDWLTLKSNRQLQGKKEFILLEAELQEAFEADKDLADYPIVYTDELFVVYAVPSQGS